MIRSIQLIILFGACLMLTACGKYPRRGESVNRGDIVESFILPNCYSIKTYTDNACIVRSFSDLDTLGGSNCQPAAFDFNSYSVIGQTITYGCNARIIRELKIDHESKQYLYTVNFKEGGFCKRLGYAYNLVKVPKIQADYTVVFRVHKD